MSKSPSNHEESTLMRSLAPLVGVYSVPRPAREQVNETMIRHWCEAMSDYNPVYTDGAFAAASIHRGIVAPPAMLDTWMMPGLGPRMAQLTEAGEPVGMVPAMELLDEAGFTAIIATNTIHEYGRYLRPGDRLRVRSAVTNVSPEKKTAVGIGHFMTAETEFVDQNGSRVGRLEFRVLKFKPRTGSIPTAADFADAPNLGLQPSPALSLSRPPRREATLRFDDVKVGSSLAPCPVPITRTQIVAGAIASRDFEPVHHDVEIAKKRGSPDIFMNIMTTGGLTCRYVTDWAGPEAILKAMNIRLGIPNFPGDSMTYEGRVEKAEKRNGVGVVELGIRGFNRLGDHVNGSLELELPFR